MVALQAPLRSPTARRAPLYPGLPVVGALPEMRRDPLALMMNARRRYGDVVRFDLLGLKALLVSDPALIEQVLVVKQRNYSKQTRGYAALRKMLGDGLVTSEGAFWLRQRRIAQPAFHKERIAGFADEMVDVGRRMIERWRPQMRSGAPFDVAEEMMRATLEIVGRTLLSTDVTGESDEVGDAVTTLLSQTFYRTTHPFLLPDAFPTPKNRAFRRARATLDRIVLGIVEERRRRGPPFTSSDGRADLLSMLMASVDEETGETMTDAQLRDEVMTIFLAGHETTANALSWTLFLLGRAPDVERRARAEVREVLGERAASLADVPRLALLGRVVKEAMRLYPPVWMLARRAEQDDELGGYFVPRGAIVFTSMLVVHRHPELWTDPEGFDPDRFLVEDPARPRYAYFPFSGGPRKCIGDAFAQMEAVLLLATILQGARLSLVPGHPVEPEPVVTLRPRHGVLVVARPPEG